MFSFPTEIQIKAATTEKADKKAKAVQAIANNLDLEALEILAIKSAKKGMSQKVKNFKNML